MKKTTCAKRFIINIILTAIICVFLGCTFDYGEEASETPELPDLVMINVEYVRVRSSDPIAKINAQRAERYETLGVMKMESLIFEQYGEHGEAVNVTGEMGFASVNIESGDIVMDNGVTLEVMSEDFIIVTEKLDWKDEPRTLSSTEGNEVNITRQNGTNFTSSGLILDARRRSWEFAGTASGVFIHEDDDDAEVNTDENIDME